MYDQSILLNLLLSDGFKTIDDHGKVLPPSNTIFKRLSEAMFDKGFPMTPKHVYTHVKENRNESLNMIHEYYCIVIEEFNDSEMEDLTFELNNFNENVNDKREFKLFVSYEKWHLMKPLAKNSQFPTNYLKFNDPWTSILAKSLWDQQRLRCCFIFKLGRVNLTQNSNCYARFKARCQECNANLKGMITHKPSKEKDVFFDCTIINYNPNVKHTKKRPLRGGLRQTITSALIDGKKYASTWRNEEAAKIMNFGDPIPPIIFSGDVLRTAKREEGDRRLNLMFPEPLSNLLNSMHSEQKNVIRNIGADPFFCIYFSEEQITLSKTVYQQGHSPRMIIDATGFGKKIKYLDGHKSQAIFLYQVMCADDEGSFPTHQMASARHDANHLSYFFGEILRSGAPHPKVIITDFGKALLLAAARSFAHCIDLRHYMNMCYNVCFSQSNAMLPKSFLRLDVSHVISMIAKWSSLSNKNAKVRQFYLRCIGQAYQMYDLQDLRDLLLSMLVVALSPVISPAEETDEPPESQKYFFQAKNTIKGLNIDDKILEELDIESFNDNHKKCKSDWSKWSSNLYKEAEVISEKCIHGASSAYFDEDLAKKLKVFFTYLPLWTAIMVPFFKEQHIIATSAAVESEFCDIKNRGVPDYKFKRIDKCILLHIEFISGKLRLKAGERYDENVEDSITKEDNSNIKLEVDETVEDQDYRISESISEKREIESEKAVHIEDRIETVDLSLEMDVTDYVSMRNLNKVENWKGKIEKSNLSDLSEEASDYCNDSSSFIKSQTKVENCSRNQKVESGTQQKKGRKKHHLSYLEKCPDFEHVQNSKFIGVPLVLNGNLCPAFISQKEKILIQNTCAFDSLCQIQMNCLATSESYETSVKSLENKFSRFSLQILDKQNFTRIHYSLRADILQQTGLFHLESRSRSIKKLDAKVNVIALADKLFADFPSLKIVYNCSECAKNEIRTIATLEIRITTVIDNGFQMLQCAINDSYQKSAPNCCGRPFNQVETTSSHLLINTDDFTNDGYLKLIQKKILGCELDHIPKTVDFASSHYKLKGIVHFIPKNEHYVAYIFNGLRWYLYDDCKKRRESVDGNISVRPGLLFYVKDTN